MSNLDEEEAIILRAALTNLKQNRHTMPEAVFEALKKVLEELQKRAQPQTLAVSTDKLQGMLECFAHLNPDLKAEVECLTEYIRQKATSNN